MNAPAVVKEITTAKPTVKAYQELQDAYDFFNERLFGSELPDMLITLQRGKKTFGYFSPNRFSGKSDHSEIAMNPDFLRLARCATPYQRWYMKCATAGAFTVSKINVEAATMIAYGARRWRKSA